MKPIVIGIIVLIILLVAGGAYFASSTAAASTADIAAAEAAAKKSEAAKTSLAAKNAPVTPTGGSTSSKSPTTSPYKGLCSFANTCPSGWEDKGTIGYIVGNDQTTKNGFGTGGKFNPGWKWQHPKLCCNVSGNTKPLSSISPNGCSDGALSGMIVGNGDLDKSGLRPGGKFNSGWTWQHYNTCKDASGEYMLGGTCPSGWTDKGVAGIITRNADVSKTPFKKGGKFNSGWTWTHPKLCKK
jgi:hypothetical protein